MSKLAAPWAALSAAVIMTMVPAMGAAGTAGIERVGSGAGAAGSPTAPSLPFTLRQAMNDERRTIRLAADEAAIADLWSQARPSFKLPIDLSTSLVLDLQATDVFAPDATCVSMRSGKTVELPVPDVRTLRGEILGEPGSHVFLALTRRGAGGGSITRADGSILSIGSDRDPRDGRPRGLIVQQGPGDAPDVPEFCRVIPTGEPGGVAGNAVPPLDAAGPRVLRVAIDSDTSYRHLFATDEDALAHMAQVIGSVDDIYRRDLNFTLRLAFTRLWPEGGEPFDAGDLEGFRDHWVGFENTEGLNLVHMFSGRRDLPYGGIAYIADACSDFAYGISATMLGSVPSDPALPPNLGNWDVDVVAHEMGHNLGTPHTHDYVPPVDTCPSGTNERGTIMSYCHTRPGGLLNTDMRMHRVTQNIIAAANASVTCLFHDCNGNGLDDVSDIAQGFSVDSNLDGIPDECQDCDGDGTLDPAQIAMGAHDVNSNGVPDACEPDCDGNGIPDRWETNHGALDANGDNRPDSCEPDCDGNGIADHQDIRLGLLLDLDRNSVPDICQDCDGNGLSDWLDVGRQFNIFVSQPSGPIREYHRASGVPVGSVAAGRFANSRDVVFGPDRQLYAADFGTHRVVRIDVDSNTLTNFVQPGAGGLKRPTGLAFGPNGNLYVVSQGTSRVMEFDGRTGAFIRQFQSTQGSAQTVLWKLAFGPDGNVYVTSGDNSVVKFSDATGQIASLFVTGASDGLSDPRGLAFLPDGTLLVANFAGNRITRHAADGSLIGQFNDEFPLQHPWAITVGPNGDVYAASQVAPVRVIEYATGQGRYLRSFIRGDEVLGGPPTGIAFRPASSGDADGDNIPDVCQTGCIADVTGDGVVDVDDLLGVVNAWGETAPVPADVTADGIVDADDLFAVINHWGECQ